MKIITDCWRKPIPIRDYDWSAVTGDYEPGHPIGFGATEQEAIEDLRNEFSEKLKDIPNCPDPNCGLYHCSCL